MTRTDVAKCTLVVFAALVVQHSLLDALSIGGAHPDLMLLVASAGGYVGGNQRGVWFAFWTGFVADLFVPTPFGLSSLSFSLAAFAVAVATENLAGASWWVTPMALCGATAIGLSAYAILGSVLGAPGMLTVDLAPALAVAVPAAFVLAGPVNRVVSWCLPAPAPSAAPSATSR